MAGPWGSQLRQAAAPRISGRHEPAPRARRHCSRMPAHDPALELAVLRAQGGEQDGFRELVRLCHGALRRHAARFLTDEGLASDAVQDAWCSIVRQLGRLDDPARFLPWALCIVARRAVDVARRRGRDKATASTVSLEGLAAEQTPALAADERERLRAAVQSLAFDHRIVVELHYEEGLSQPPGAPAAATPQPPGPARRPPRAAPAPRTAATGSRARRPAPAPRATHLTQQTTRSERWTNLMTN